MSFDERVLNGMSVLSAVVHSGSFASAGAALNMSQPGVSRAISRLEARLGIRLLERTTRSVSLTDEGRRLYEQIVPLLAGLEEAASSVVGGRTTVQGRLRVNVHPTFSPLILGANLKMFLEKYPDLKLELINRDQLGDLIAEGFDLAIRFGYPRPSAFRARKLLDTRILTVAAPSYLKRHGRPATPQDLERNDHTFIDFRDPETERPFQWEFQRGRKIIQISTAGQLVVSDVATMHNLCLAGYGIAQMLELSVHKSLASGRLIELFPEWPDERFPLYAIYPSRHHLPAKTRAFLDFIAAVTRSNFASQDAE